jgi:hypothetical protein
MCDDDPDPCNVRNGVLMFKDLLRQRVRANRYLTAINRLRHGHTPVYIEYDIRFAPRWTAPPGNPHLASLIAGSRDRYLANLGAMQALRPTVERLLAGTLPVRIDWRNHFIPALDGLSLMRAALAAGSTYMEIGSGNSTLFAKAALLNANRPTRIVSIDPMPRADVDAICDEVIRSPLENLDPALFDRLKPGDTLFVDNSHRSFMNSDVTVFMLDVLPRIPAGVLVGIHDIFLPFDYFGSWADRGYNEQYLLACYLLANRNYFDLELANYWISTERLHDEPLKAIWSLLGEEVRDRPASAFWAVKRGDSHR